MDEAPILEAYTCYIHKPGTMVPDLRVVASPSRSDVSQLVFEEVHRWGRFEKIDVFDEQDQLVFSLRTNPEPAY
jgi:hypothetical protein